MWSRVGIEFLHRRQLGEIVVFTARDKDFTAAAFAHAKRLDDVGAEEARAAGDEGALVMPKARRHSSPLRTCHLTSCPRVFNKEFLRASPIHHDQFWPAARL